MDRIFLWFPLVLSPPRPSCGAFDGFVCLDADWFKGALHVRLYIARFWIQPQYGLVVLEEPRNGAPSKRCRLTTFFSQVCSVASSLSTRQLVRVARRLSQYPREDLEQSIRKACLARYSKILNRTATGHNTKASGELWPNQDCNGAAWGRLRGRIVASLWLLCA